MALTHGFVAGAAIYTVGQSFNFLLQLLLLRQFGLEIYGEVGLAHLALLTIMFIGDLGYGSLFLREDPSTPQWTLRWRIALTHRLVLTLALDLLALAGWIAVRGTGGDGFAYLLGSMPATLFCLAGFSAPLLAQGRRIGGFLVQQVVWPVATLGWLLFSTTNDLATGLHAGLAVSAGFLLQAGVNLLVFRRPDLLRPARGAAGRGMLGSALHLSTMAIVGTLHDRLTPFLVAQVAPGFLSVYILLGHGMNGISGIVAQLNRLLLAQAESKGSLRWALGFGSLLIAATASAFPLLLLACDQWGDARERRWLELALPVLLAWSVATASSPLAALLIGRRQERELARIMLCGLAASAALQGAAFVMDAPWALLWGRLLCLLGIAAACLYLARIEPRASGLLLLSSALCAAMSVDARWLLIGSALLLLAGLCAAVRQPLLFREARVRETGGAIAQ